MLKDEARPLDWNGPRRRSFDRFRETGLNRPIIEHFEQSARRHGERVAIRDADRVLTYAELWSGASGLAETLTAATRPGDLIGILLPACPMFPLAMLGCLAAGRAFVVLDTEYPRAWLDHVLDDAQPTLILALDDFPSGVEARAGVRVIHLTGVPQPARKGWQPAALGPDEPACVLFTSGSTGRPKGIVNSQRNLLQRVAQSINAAHINSADRLLTLASPCTIVGVRDVLTALLAGASIHLLPPQDVGAREVLNVIREEQVTILFAFPALLRSVVAARATRAGAALRLVRVGGDTILWSDIDLLRAWLAPDAAIQSIYAATEAPIMQWFVDEAYRGTDERVPIGYPLPGNHLSLADESGQPVRTGQSGELVVESAYVSLGQWVGGRCVERADKSAGERSERLFRSGDLARQRPDGLLERIGRKDRQVKIRGSRVDLDGVEAAIRAHAGVRDVAAFARTSSADGTITLVAYVSAREAAPAGLIEELKEKLHSVPSPMRPARFYVVPEIPRLPSSKLDVHALAKVDGARMRIERTEPTTPAERSDIADHITLVVTRAWEELLLVPVRGPEDDFFENGGDSLKAMSFVAALERALGQELSPTLLNEAPKFAQLCALLREARPAGGGLLVTLKPGEGVPPLFFVHGVGGNVVEMLPAARRVSYRGAVIGIRARGLVRGEKPHSSVYAMAADYLKEIKRRQPVGPYHLCGYSFGGLVAYEMAQQLSASGSEVAFVGLFDTLMSPVRWPLRAWLTMAGSRLARLCTGLRSPSPPPVQPSAPKLMIRVAASALFASARYRPGFYPGQLTLFTPAEREPGLPSLETIWRRHAKALSVIETAGSHATMLSAANADSTAALLTHSLSNGGTTRRPDVRPSARDATGLGCPTSTGAAY
jgi:amino acid adenylation domain-containing protein